MLTNYLSPNRWYHNLEHVADLLRRLPELFDAYRDQIQYPEELIQAIIWHDETCDPGKSGSNERMSARSAVRANPLLNGDMITRFIMATVHDGGHLEMIEEQIIVDLDLCGLASDFMLFVENSNDIRREYRDVSHADWVKGRCDFFRSMLSRPRIFYTGIYHRRYEEKARSNMQTAIELLEKGQWPDDV